MQIRDIDDDVYAALQHHAAMSGMSDPELLRREVARIAARPTLEEWLARTRRRTSSTTRSEVLASLDELRGPWRDGGR